MPCRHGILRKTAAGKEPSAFDKVLRFGNRNTKRMPQSEKVRCPKDFSVLTIVLPLEFCLSHEKKQKNIV